MIKLFTGMKTDNSDFIDSVSVAQQMEPLRLYEVNRRLMAAQMAPITYGQEQIGCLGLQGTGLKCSYCTDTEVEFVKGVVVCSSCHAPKYQRFKSYSLGR